MGADDQSQTGDGAAASAAFEWDVLVSYGRADRCDLARRIVDALRAKGLKVWFDEEELDPGDEPATGIAEGLENSRAAAFIISPSSLKSRWVSLETNLAISRWADGDWQGRIIPLLAGVDKPPDFLQTRLWLDFADDSRFDENIEALVRGILKGGPTAPGGGRGEEDRRLLSRLSFLGFFPEGVLVRLYDHLVSKRASAGEAALAERRGLVRAVKTDGPELRSAAPGLATELGSYVTDKAEAAYELLAEVEEWIEEEQPFEFIAETGIGVGRALLVRDMMSLARDLLPREGEEAGEKREKACEYARELLPEIVEEGLLRIGLEISVALRAVSSIQRVADNLMHARVLLRAGDAAQAADIFDLYRGDNLFGEYGLSQAERLACALEWAMALKNARRAGPRHAEIMEAYGPMLDLVGQMRAAAPPGSDDPLRSKAELHNNRATQIAVYGTDAEWPVAEEDFATASDIYRLVGDDGRLIATSANAVAHTLDRFDRIGKKPTPEELAALLQSLEAMNAYADRGVVGEDLFFFLYQKARLLKRLHPDEPQRAREVYESAAWVADQAQLPQRAAVARRWVLLLRDEAHEISEADYLIGLRECAASLERYQDDAWSYNALVENYLGLARILSRHQNKEEAWVFAQKAFALGARRSAWKKSESARDRLKMALRLLNGLNVGEGLREAFIAQNAPLLRALLNIPAYKPVSWERVAAQLV